MPHRSARARSRPRGLSLPELLVSGLLLLLLTGLFMLTFNPTLQRQGWLFGRQTATTLSLVGRERLASMLGATQLVPPDQMTPSTPGRQVLLELYRPITTNTPGQGELPELDLREMVIYDTTRRFQLALLDQGELVESDSQDSFRRMLWPLGPGGQVQITLSADLRQVDMVVSGVIEPGRPQEAHWSHSMTFFTH